MSIIYAGIRETANKTGIKREILRRAKLHPECPRGIYGFHSSGRVYFDKPNNNGVTLEKWLHDNIDELKQPKEGSKEYWVLHRLRSQTLLLEAELEERKANILNKQDCIDTMERMRQAYNQLMQSKLKGELVERIQLKPEDTIHLDSFIQEMDQVWLKGIESLR